MKKMKCEWGTCDETATETVAGHGYCASCAPVARDEVAHWMAQGAEDQSGAPAWMVEWLEAHTCPICGTACPSDLYDEDVPEWDCAVCQA